MNKVKSPVIFIALLAAFALIGSLINSRASVIRAAGGPTVTIDPAQLPLQVTGSTTVSGTVGISGNTAATPLFVHEVGTTSVLTDQFLTSTDTLGSNNPVITLDTSAAKTIRINASNGNCSPCSSVRVDVYSGTGPPPFESILIDQFTVSTPFGTASHVYEVPGTSIRLQVANTAAGVNSVHLVVLARSN
jgi:hypothetical protein